MPVYEYCCDGCGERVELQRSFDDRSVPVCPACGAEGLVRRFSRVSVVVSQGDRTSDLSWIDHDVAQRIRRKVTGKVNPALGETLDRMESGR